MFAGNKLTCDCRVSWIQVLRNETKSEPLRLALDDVTCIPIDRTDSTVNDVIIDSDPRAPKVEQIYEIEANSEASEDDDEIQLKYEPTVQPVIASQIAVVDMPLESMPCSSGLIQKGEDSLMLSSKDESFWQASSSNHILMNISLVLILLVITL